MLVRYAMALMCPALALFAAPAHAGPCTQQIYDADLAVGKALGAAAARGKAGPQSTFATKHRQPTPSSIASAEEKLGDISPADLQTLNEEMDEARKADATGDLAACQKALDLAMRFLNR
jgi:hypothetical protein